MALYQVQVQDIAARRHVIAQKAATNERSVRFYHYGADGLDLPVVQLDIGIPVYRMANYRTRTRQRAYIHSHNLPENYFLSGEEDDSFSVPAG